MVIIFSTFVDHNVHQDWIMEEEQWIESSDDVVEEEELDVVNNHTHKNDGRIKSDPRCHKISGALHIHDNDHDLVEEKTNRNQTKIK
mmetsp:Transcript_4284/g.4569  ORF Transcript_4284/g.4569 Transcript_4284/m.4569 type:complete len:87 (+) Transcript_4284:1-261(+)